MRKILLFFFTVLFVSEFTTFAQVKDVEDEAAIVYDKSESSRHSNQEAVEAWMDRRFGLFVHWGPSATTGNNHSHARKSELNHGGNLPAEEYDKLYKSFNPIKFDAEEWADMAYNAGMRYIVFTTKHHDGFSVFSSDATDYDMDATPYGKDVLKEIADAFHKRDMGFGLYYSPRDWYHPDYNKGSHDKYNEFYIQQMTELASNYGQIDIFWFDGTNPAGESKWKGTLQKVGDMLYEKHPQIMCNDRAGFPGNFETFEQRNGYYNLEEPWETCMTITTAGWIHMNKRTLRPYRELLRHLVYTAGRNGNYLLNLGPTKEGIFDPEHVARLNEIGNWMKVNKESILETRGGPFLDGTWGTSTRKNNNIYLIVTEHPGEILKLPPIDAKIKKAEALAGGKIEFEQDKNGIEFKIPLAQRDSVATAIKLTIDKPAMELKAIRVQKNLAEGAKLTASNVLNGDMEKYGPQNAVDNSFETIWETENDAMEVSMEVDFGEPKLISAASITQYAGWYPESVELQVLVNNKWKKVYSARSKVTQLPIIEFEPLNTEKVKLIITKRRNPFPSSINDFRIFAP